MPKASMAVCQAKAHANRKNEDAGLCEFSFEVFRLVCWVALPRPPSNLKPPTFFWAATFFFPTACRIFTQNEPKASSLSLFK